jgi:1-deoxy-D-xylulose-5-phosphate synthase
MLVHVVTKKGKGYPPAEAADDKYHGVLKFDVISGEQAKSEPGPPSYTGVFAKALIAEAERDDKVVAITAAMPAGTGLDLFGARYPHRLFDVGIAEQHAGILRPGWRRDAPFLRIYSTFPQRACQAGGALRWTGRGWWRGWRTHAGALTLPISRPCNMVVMAAADEASWCIWCTLPCHDDGPIAVCHLRGNGLGVALPGIPGGWRSARAGCARGQEGCYLARHAAGER